MPTESYLYDQDGQRVKKTSNGVTTYYVNQLYEVSGGVVTKYYYFGGQRIAMRKNGTLTYLHSDHLGSTVLETNTSGNPTANQQYCAYGRKRTLSNGTTVCGSGNSLATDHTFTGQQLDATGLQYFNARYYDPAIGTFISPDTIVPDATNVFDYNRYMYTRGNPFKYNDPTGHDPCDNGSKNCDPLWLEYNKGETSCSTGRCGIPYERFLDAKQQYAAYKSNPDQYAADQQILNGDIAGDVESAKTRISNAMLYASYFAHRNPDIDITLEASTAILLSSITTLSGTNKDIVTSSKFRGPAAKGFDWDHIFDRHSDTGATAKQRTTGTIFEGLSKSQIQAQVKAAWSNRELMETQSDLASGISRMRYQGVDPVSGQRVEMWYNSSTRIVETAYPVR